jgi:hypothetical protein
MLAGSGHRTARCGLTREWTALAAAIGSNGPMRLDRLQIGGWTLRETAAATFAERADVRVDAVNPLLDFGVLPTSPPSPSGSPSPSGTQMSGSPSVRVPNVPLHGGSPNGSSLRNLGRLVGHHHGNARNHARE